MNGYFGAVGKVMSSDLEKLLESHDYSGSANSHRLELQGRLDGGEPAAILINCASHLICQDTQSPNALIIDGHILAERFVKEEHPRDVLEAVKKAGLDAIRDEDGFYALAFIDARSGTLSLLRDQWGSQTIYYISDERGFAFSTSITPLISLIRQPAMANLTSAHRFLTRGDAPLDGETFFSDIKQVPMRSILTFDPLDDMSVTIDPFHTPLKVSRHDLNISFDQAVIQARSLFSDSVNNCLRHSSVTGFTLSGGLDSSAGVMMAKETLKTARINTYSYVTNVRKSIDEEKYIDIVNESCGASENKLKMEALDYFHYLPIATRGLGTPIFGTSQLAQYILYEMASEDDVDTMINGVEADSAFCGHAYFLVDRLLELLEQRSIGQSIRLVNQVIRLSTSSQLRFIAIDLIRRLPGWLSRAIMAIIHPTTTVRWLGFSLPPSSPLRRRESPSMSGERRLQTHMMRQLSHDRHLRYAELCGAAFSIYSRTPFLYRELNEFILSLPSQFLISSRGETKLFLRAVADGVVPDEVLGRRDKIGFEAPTKEWFSEQPQKVRDYLELGVTQGILARDHKLLQSNSYNTIARAIAFSEWARTFSVKMA